MRRGPLRRAEVNWLKLGREKEERKEGRRWKARNIRGDQRKGGRKERPGEEKAKNRE